MKPYEKLEYIIFSGRYDTLTVKEAREETLLVLSGRRGLRGPLGHIGPTSIRELVIGSDQCGCDWSPDAEYPACPHDNRGPRGEEGPIGKADFPENFE